jgi:glycogenin
VGEQHTDSPPMSEPIGERHTEFDAHAPAEPSMTGSSITEYKSEPLTPSTPTTRVIPSDPWTTFTRTNAWDEVPEIERYVEGLQKHRRVKSQGLSGGSIGHRPTGSGSEARGLKLTDFPTEIERPSLPVTPAPIRRPKFWDGGVTSFGSDEEQQLLPAAEGVPAQTDWVCVHGNWWSPADCLCDLTNILRYHKDPIAQLQKLAKQQSEALLRRLGGGESGPDGGSRDIPSRALPFGSEEVISPTFIDQSSGEGVLSPQPVKGPTTTSRVRNILSEQESLLPAPPEGTTAPATLSTPIKEPSYTGPGLAWEKGEDLPVKETPALPTEEQRDILEA